MTLCNHFQKNNRILILEWEDRRTCCWCSDTWGPDPWIKKGGSDRIQYLFSLFFLLSFFDCLSLARLIKLEFSCVCLFRPWLAHTVSELHNSAEVPFYTYLTFSDGIKDGSARVLAKGSCRISSVSQHSSRLSFHLSAFWVSDVGFKAHVGSVMCVSDSSGSHKHTFLASAYLQRYWPPTSHSTWMPHLTTIKQTSLT